jgi:hypothetical protein
VAFNRSHAPSEAPIEHTSSTARAFDVPIEIVVEILRLPLRRVGHELVGPCPRCKDGDNRFAVHLIKQCWHCRVCDTGGKAIQLIQFVTGCSVEEACNIALGEPPPPARPNGAGKNGARERAEKILVEEYIYTNLDGTPRYREQRVQLRGPGGNWVLDGDKPDKLFWQGHPDPNRPGRWLKGMEGVKLIPYRLPELSAAVAAGELVIVVEGERKADLLHRHLGLTATTAPMGAGKWPPYRARPENFDQYFVGADVVILPDNDDKGHEHARDVAGKLTSARSIKIVELPGLGPKDDVVEWYERGGTKEALLALVDMAAVYEKPIEEKQEEPESELPEGVTLDDFDAYMPQHTYIYGPTGQMWPAVSVNASIPPPQKKVSASTWLDRHKPVQQMTWYPGLPRIIKDRLLIEGGWDERRGVRCYNLYRPPDVQLGDKNAAGPWLKHIAEVYPDAAVIDHIVKFLAHLVQHPGDKINHGLLLGGNQGIGKDTILAPLKYAVGWWNFTEVNPEQVMGNFTGFLKHCAAAGSRWAQQMGAPLS